MSGQLACVILAAGRSTRFKSSKSKLLHELAGRPLVEWALDTLLELEPAQIVIVYGEHSAELPRRYQNGYRGTRIDFVLQDPPQGTADALSQAEQVIGEEIENIIVMPGDAPLMTAAHLRQLEKVKSQLRCDHVVISAEVASPFGYGRIVRDPDSPEMVAMIVEESDASAEKKLLKEINSSMYLFGADVFEHLRVASELIGRSKVKGEFYLTDVARVSSMGAYKIDDASLIEGLNDRLQLSQMDELVQRRLRERWMREGVSFVLPETSYLHADVKLAQDVTVGPQCYLAHGTSVGSGTRLQQGCHLDACRVGENCNLLHVHAHEVEIGNGVRIGPYANLRPGTVLGDDVRVGNFVETKKARVGRGSKLPHLSYVGDATIGENCNIGAGTIFCNYDGINKHHTTLGDGVFVGSNSSLQAPLLIGDGAFVAMASAVTRDVPAGALAVARARQENKAGYVERLRRRQAGGAPVAAEEAVSAGSATEDAEFEATIDAADADALPPLELPAEAAMAGAVAVQSVAGPEDPSSEPPASRYKRLSVEEVRDSAPVRSANAPVEPLQIPDPAVVFHEIGAGEPPKLELSPTAQIEELAGQMSDSVLGGGGSLGIDPGFSGSLEVTGYIQEGLNMSADLRGEPATLGSAQEWPPEKVPEMPEPEPLEPEWPEPEVPEPDEPEPDEPEEPEPDEPEEPEEKR